MDDHDPETGADLEPDAESVPDPDRPNPLGPYFPSEVPRVSGNGRRWFAVLALLAFVAWVLATLLELLVAVA